MSSFKERFIPDINYDKQEIFTFKDGGHIYLHYKGDLSKNNPIIFIVPGLTSHS